MNILADENIPYVSDACAAGLGDVRTMAGRAMDRAAVADADILFVRSITRVNADLLEGSPVKFVGTATIGEDHIDKAYLAERGIGFSSAPGCNATSVAEYITAALLELAIERGSKLCNKTLGIVGHGNVGRRVEQKARALGMEVVLNDPPLERETGDSKYRPLEEVFEQCAIVTVHVPLTKDGPDPTYHLLGESFFDRLRTGAIVFNTSRGSVADGQALRTALEDGRVGACVLDVWEGEPNIDLDLMANCAIATPHISGYSFDGKVDGTLQIYEAACRHFDIEATWDPTPALPEPDCPEITVNGDEGIQTALHAAVKAVYPIRRDEAALRGIIHIPEADRAAAFDRLRKEYPRRREFTHTRALVEPANADLQRALTGLGFTSV